MPPQILLIPSVFEDVFTPFETVLIPLVFRSPHCPPHPAEAVFSGSLIFLLASLEPSPMGCIFPEVSGMPQTGTSLVKAYPTLVLPNRSEVALTSFLSAIG